jgi:hypothetical protein
MVVARRGMDTAANGLRFAGLAIVVVLCLHILLTVLEANPANGLTVLVAQAADVFDMGLSNLFLPDNQKVRVALNYGTAAVLWYLITVVVVRLVRRMG